MSESAKPCGKIIAFVSVTGERYFWLVDRQGIISVAIPYPSTGCQITGIVEVKCE